METLASGTITPGHGLEGDFRGSLKSGRNKREVTVMTIADWRQACDEAGLPELDWWHRRASLLVDAVALPREKGALIHIGNNVILAVTGQTDPCDRMDNVAEGLRLALTPEWRGGVTTRVVQGGSIAVGCEVRIETP